MWRAGSCGQCKGCIALVVRPPVWLPAAQGFKHALPAYPVAARSCMCISGKTCLAAKTMHCTSCRLQLQASLPQPPWGFPCCCLVPRPWQQAEQRLTCHHTPYTHSGLPVDRGCCCGLQAPLFRMPGCLAILKRISSCIPASVADWLPCPRDPPALNPSPEPSTLNPEPWCSWRSIPRWAMRCACARPRAWGTLQACARCTAAPQTWAGPSWTWSCPERASEPCRSWPRPAPPACLWGTWQPCSSLPPGGIPPLLLGRPRAGRAGAGHGQARAPCPAALPGSSGASLRLRYAAAPWRAGCCMLGPGHARQLADWAGFECFAAPPVHAACACCALHVWSGACVVQQVHGGQLCGVWGERDVSLPCWRRQPWRRASGPAELGCKPTRRCFRHRHQVGRPPSSWGSLANPDIAPGSQCRPTDTGQPRLHLTGSVHGPHTDFTSYS